MRYQDKTHGWNGIISRNKFDLETPLGRTSTKIAGDLGRAMLFPTETPLSASFFFF